MFEKILGNLTVLCLLTIIDLYFLTKNNFLSPYDFNLIWLNA